MKYLLLVLLCAGCVPKQRPCLSQRQVECQSEDPLELEFWEDDVAFMEDIG